ncbi:hypothetical protein BDQ94DRAFT_155990, partial [Aspergillus welwitschiae]
HGQIIGNAVLSRNACVPWQSVRAGIGNGYIYIRHPAPVKDNSLSHFSIEKINRCHFSQQVPLIDCCCPGPSTFSGARVGPGLILMRELSRGFHLKPAWGLRMRTERIFLPSGFDLWA